ncbi:MAG: DNRLRE domain-containing protein [candidate division Zixibacteria bacterium]|nr:DNRLRE domain-containing protein [candidate division Zixibacteria bacterium]
MRFINIILAITLCVSPAFAGEATVDLDKVAMLTPTGGDASLYGPRVALHFSLPEVVDGGEIVSAELYMPIDLSNVEVEGETILEVMAQNITAGWTEQNASWANPWTESGGDLDSLSFYSYTINITDDEVIRLDLTEFVRSIVQDDADNYGLMLMPFKHDQEIFELPQNTAAVIKNAAQLNIVFE